jgi:CHAD domain-containing protein
MLRTPFWVVSFSTPPPVPAIAVTDAALVAVAQRRMVLKDARKRFLSAPEPDALHDLRVAVRRLRAAIGLFGPAIVLPRRSREDRLQRLGRRLSRLRDVDVVRGALASDEAVAAGVAPALSERLAAKRLTAAARAERMLRRERTKRLLRGLTGWERRPRFAMATDQVIGDVLPQRLQERAEAFAEHPGWALKLRRDGDGRLEDAEKALDRDGLHDVLHELRRRAKRVRYELEIAGPLLGRDEAPAVSYLRDIQDALGELQDVRVIEAALDRLDLAQRPGEPFRHWLRDRRYRALERWRRLRRKRGSPVTAFAADPALPRVP